MSYDISVFHPSVKQKVEGGLAFDGFEHDRLEAAEVEAFLESLTLYGYQQESETPQRKGFVKKVGRCPIQVGVYATEISFSVPSGKGSEEAVFEALQDASELCDTDGLALFNPQTGEWFDPEADQ